MIKEFIKTTKTANEVKLEIYEFETTCDLSLSAQRVKCTFTDIEDERPAPDEICLLISADDEYNDELPITLSLSNAEKLGMTLLKLVDSPLIQQTN